MVSGAESHRVTQVAASGCGRLRHRAIGLSRSPRSGVPDGTTSRPRGYSGSPMGVATADPRCAWALATRWSFRWRPAPCSTRRPGRPPGVSLSASAGLRMASSGPMATPRTRTAMTTRTSTGSFFSTVVHHSGWCAARAPRLSRLSSACSVTSSKTNTSPGRRANTGRCRPDPLCARRGLERCSRPGLSGRSRSTLQPAAALQAAVSHGRDPDPAPPCSTTQGRRGRVVDGLGCLHRIYWCRSCDVYGRGTACWTCSSTKVQWDHVPPLELGRSR